MNEKIKLEKEALKQELLKSIESVSEPNKSEQFEENDVDIEGLSKRELKKLRRLQKNSKRQTRHNNLIKDLPENLADKLYKKDYEDIIDDIPVRYNYRHVTPNSYGLTAEEILLCDDKELNKWCSLRKIVMANDPIQEKNIEKLYEKKAKFNKYRQKILKSLYSKEEPKNDSSNKFEKKKTYKISYDKKKIVKRHFNRATSSMVKKLPVKRLLAYKLNSYKPNDKSKEQN